MRSIFLIIAGLMLGCGISLYSAAYTTSEKGLLKGAFGDATLQIEYALTDEARQRGLGGRESIPENYGMLFVFPRSDRYGFWMKDTLVPLDMFWLDEGGKVVFMAQNVPPSSFPQVFYPMTPALYVLETAAGFGAAHAVATGTPLRLKKLPIVSE